MNDDFDQFEAELSALKPHAPSAALKQRIARDVEIGELAPAKPPLGRAWWIGAVSGGLVAASLAAGLLLRPAPSNISTDSSLGPLQVSPSAAFDDAQPSVWTYRRALRRSPLAAEDLLDKHAAHAPRSHSSATPIFVRSDSALFLHGEL